MHTKPLKERLFLLLRLLFTIIITLPILTLAILPIISTLMPLFLQ
jgi:antibiotic biosynthesis monooxygenase (ABM) superfamily enzyme